MVYQVYKPENGPFPPPIPETKLSLCKTEFAGGNGIASLGGCLYLVNRALEGGSLSIFAADGEALMPLATLGGLGNTRAIAVSDTVAAGRRIAAVTARENGLYLIDVTDPQAPFICCHYNTVEFATGVTFFSHFVAVACRSFGVEFLDLADLSAPRHVSAIRAGEVQSIVVHDGVLYTGSWRERQVNAFDISDVARPRAIFTLPQRGRADGVWIKDGKLFVAFGHHPASADFDDCEDPRYGRGNGFAIFDISDRENPKELSVTVFPIRYYYSNYDMWNVTPCGNYAVVSHTFNGIWVYDVTDPTAPVLVDHAAIPATRQHIKLPEAGRTLRLPMLPFDPTKVQYAPVTGVAAEQGRLYITVGNENLFVAKGHYFAPLRHAQGAVREGDTCYYDTYAGDAADGVEILHTKGQVHAIALLGDRVYAACGMGGIRVFDTALNELSACKTEGFAMDIRAENGKLYAALGAAGVAIYKPEGDTLVRVGGTSLEGRPCAQVVPSKNGKYLFVHTGDKPLSVLDITDLADIREVRRDKGVPGLLYHRQLVHTGVDGRYYGGYWHAGNIRWYDTEGDIFADGAAVQGRLGFPEGVTATAQPHTALAVFGGGYVAFDIRKEEQFSNLPIARIEGVTLSGKPVVAGNMLYVCDRLEGDVVIADISDLAAPRLVRRLNFSGHPDLACPIKEGVLIPLGHQGIARVLL